MPLLDARRIDLSAGHPVHSRRTRVRAGQCISMVQHVFATNLVVEQIEAESGLRLAMEHSLKGPDIFRCFETSSPITMSAPSSKAHQKSGFFPPPALPGLVGHTTLSDPRPVRRLMRRRGCELQPRRPLSRGFDPASYPTIRARTKMCACRRLCEGRYAVATGHHRNTVDADTSGRRCALAVASVPFVLRW